MSTPTTIPTPICDKEEIALHDENEDPAGYAVPSNIARDLEKQLHVAEEALKKIASVPYNDNPSMDNERAESALSTLAEMRGAR